MTEKNIFSKIKIKPNKKCKLSKYQLIKITNIVNKVYKLSLNQFIIKVSTENNIKEQDKISFLTFLVFYSSDINCDPPLEVYNTWKIFINDKDYYSFSRSFFHGDVLIPIKNKDIKSPDPVRISYFLEKYEQSTGHNFIY